MKTLGGIPFFIGQFKIQMGGKLLPDHPKRVPGIIVERNCSRLHFLHACRWGAYGKRGDGFGHWVPDGTPIGYYEVIYEDGSSAAVPIVYGHDVRDWWSVWDKMKPCPSSTVVWTGTNDHLETRREVSPDFPPLRLFHTAWTNPRPDLAVTSIDVVSVDAVPAPFCVAITAQCAPQRYDGALDWSRDGAWLASAHGDGSIRLWKSDGTPGGVLAADSKGVRGHKGPVNALAFSPDGKRLVSVGQDGTLRLWRIADEKLLAVHNVLNGVPVTAVDWSPDGTRIVAGFENGLRLWDGDTKLVSTLDEHVGTVSSVAFSPDSKMFFVGGLGRVAANPENDIIVGVRFWRGPTGQPLHVLYGHSRPVTSVAWSRDGQQGISASRDGSIRLWGTDETPGPVISEPGRVFTALATTPKGASIAVASADGEVRIHVGEGKPPRIERAEESGQPGYAVSVVFSPDGKQFAWLTNNETIYVTNLEGEATLTFGKKDEKKGEILDAQRAQRLKDLAAELKQLNVKPAEIEKLLDDQIK